MILEVRTPRRRGGRPDLRVRVERIGFGRRTYAWHVTWGGSFAVHRFLLPALIEARRRHRAWERDREAERRLGEARWRFLDREVARISMRRLAGVLRRGSGGLRSSVSTEVGYDPRPDLGERKEEKDA